MRRGIILSGVLALSFLGSQAQIADRSVNEDFKRRESSLKRVKSASVFNRKLTKDQRDALKVLYAYMPLSDMADRSADFFMENVNTSLRARKEMPWGAKVPDREFRHFVLPVRVNDEAIDLHRPVFYNELKDRVKNLSMKDAILEINHWCHEKACYQPSDGRTHPPLLTVYTGIGRCGEESTFTVAALRSMGIPARQVYTPRWAHTDDNHAWVEAWADGKWYFLGACEPEPVLNLGWFNSPASRGMLMNSRTYGRYDGPEEKLLARDFYTDINVTSNYAPVDTLKVKVVDLQGKPIAGSSVSYRLYNYAEFYPIATKVSDKNGESSLVAGLGDLLIWASDGKSYGFKKASVGKDREVVVTIGGNGEKSIDLNIVPPVVGSNLTLASPEAAEANKIRLAKEDSIRGAYYSTFCTPEKAEKIAEELQLSKDDLKYVMNNARGNHKVIDNFLRSVKKSDRERAMSLLKAITVKDLSDIKADVLNDCMLSPASDSKLYVDYILSPRVAQEELTPYKAYFKKQLPAALQEECRKNPLKWVEWVSNNIDAREEWYPAKTRMLPIGVYQTRRTAETSRDIFFVAAARSMDIPARIDPVTGKTQWADADGNWNDANFDKNKKNLEIKNSPKGRLKLTYNRTGRIDDPKYYINFSISKIENGETTLMNFPEDGTWNTLFKDSQEMDAGDYMLVTGQRLADGGVLSKIDFFTIDPDKEVVLPLVIRQDNAQVQVIGNFDVETIYHDSASEADKSLLSTTGRGYYVLGILKPNNEPTNHALRDIAAVSDDLEKWGRSIVLLYDDNESLAKADKSILELLPKTTVLGVDKNGVAAKAIIDAMKLSESERPIFIIADTFNRVVLVSQGYTIGLGERLIDIIHKLK